MQGWDLHTTQAERTNFLLNCLDNLGWAADIFTLSSELPRVGHAKQLGR